MTYLIMGLVFVATSLAVYAYGDRAAGRKAVRSSLLAIDDHVITRVRERQLLGPIGERVVAPVLQRMGELGRTVTPAGYIEQARRKLTVMGHGTPAAVDRFLAVRAATVVAIPVVFVLGFGVIGVSGLVGLLVVGFVAVALLLGPDAVINRRIAARQLRIRRQLPDLLDLLTISVEAGLGFEQALDRTISGIPGDLSDEFIRMLGEMRAGAGRMEAMRAVDARTDVAELRSFVMAMIQAESFGSSISRVLRSQAKELRIKRRQLAQELAQKAPVKMLLPMVLCIFPAMFVVVLGPATINIMHGGLSR